MSVWTRPEDDYLPLVPPEWRDAAQRWLVRTLLHMRLPIALTGGLFASLGVMLLLTPDVPPPPAGGDIGAGAWTRQIDMPPRLSLRAAASAETATWSRETNEGRETEDRLTFGAIDGGPYLVVVAARRPAAAPTPGFFVSSVRSAANAGLAIGRFGRTGDHPGPFGATETAAVSLTSPAQHVARTDCVAWRAGDQEIGLSGFLCTGGTSIPDTTALDCALRDLIPAPGSDALLRQTLKQGSPSVACKTAIAETTRSGASRSVAGTRQQGKL